MFNVVIEKENYSDIDALVIREDINNIVQSIEEQLYNINVSYRNNVRKIKNSLKSLEGISESSLVILENENINDENLISYLTNVLEISLDCIVSTLYENKEYRPLLKNVNNISSLLDIDSSNTKIFKNILEQCEDLFNVYAQINEIEISSTSFYELLDKSIENSVNAQSKYIPEDIKTEVDIYNKVIENLDSLVTNDLVTTYDNIKVFAASQVKQVNEAWYDSILTSIANYGVQRPLRLFGAGIVSVFALTGIPFLYILVKNLFSKNPLELSTDRVDELFAGNIHLNTISSLVKNSPITKEQYLNLTQYINNIKDKDGYEIQYAYLNALIVEKRTYIENLLSTINEQELQALQAQISDAKSKLEAISNQTQDRNTELSTIQNEQNLLKTNISQLETQRDNLVKEVKINENSLNIAQQTYNDFIKYVQELKQDLGDFQFYFFATVITGGLLFLIVSFVSAIFTRKKVFGTAKSSNTIKTILKLRKQIDKLKDTTIVSYPDLKIQFDYLSSEVKKCEREGTIKNDFMIIYNCGMKYFMGNYAIIMYSALLQLSKDGISLHKFNKLSDVHNYNGFASMQTRGLIKSLNEFYTNLLDYDATLVDAFEKIFTIAKQQVLENKLTDNIVKQLPNRLTTTMAG